MGPVEGHHDALDVGGAVHADRVHGVLAREDQVRPSPPGRTLDAQAEHVDQEPLDRRGDGAVADREAHAPFVAAVGAATAVFACAELDTEHVAYMEARDRGADVSKAALAGRDSTVDFSQRGSLANWVGLMWPFGNTAIQTSARMESAWSRGARLTSKFAKYAIGGSFAAGFAVTMFNYMFGGEDDQGTPNIENVPDYVRRLNMTIMLPGTKDRNNEPYALTVALPYNYAMPYTLGQVAAHFAAKAAGYAKEHTGEVMRMAMHSILEGLIGLPQESSLLGKATPALLVPSLHVAMNETFFGSPLHTPWPKKGLAASEQGRPNTPEFWKTVAKGANALGGGDEYHSSAFDAYPESWKEQAGWLTSALERFGTKATSGSVSDIASGKMPIPEETPFLDTLLKSSKTFNQARQGRFYELKNDLTQKAEAYKEAVKRGDTAGAEKLMAKHEKEIAAHDQLKSFESALRNINKARNQMRADNSTPDEEKKGIMQELDGQTRSIQNQASKILGGFLHE